MATEDNKIKISHNQLFALAANGALGSTIFVISGLLTEVAKQDAWITALITLVWGLLLVWLYYYLGKHYPGLTLIGINQKILGKWPGTILSAAYVFLFLHVTTNAPWYVGDFIGHIMPETPDYILYILFMTAVIAAVLYGLEAFARASEIFIIFVSIIFFVAIILILPKANIDNLLPVLEDGIFPSFKGSFFLFSFTTFPMLALMMIFPVNTSDLPQAAKAFARGYLWGSLIVFIAVIISILVLGSNIISSTQYASFLLFKEIDVGIIFSRLEFVIMTIWLVTQFVTCVLFFYAGVKGFAELFGLKDYRKVILPLGLIVTVLTGIIFPDANYQANWDSIVWPPYGTTFCLIIPGATAIILGIKKKFFRRG